MALAVNVRGTPPVTGRQEVQLWTLPLLRQARAKWGPTEALIAIIQGIKTVASRFWLDDVGWG